MSSAPLTAGAAIAPGYEVIEHLSRGRRLDVYDAWSEERGCRCVIKIPRPERADERSARELLAREGELLCRLSHPHMVRGYETLRRPVPMVVMETLGGQTLAHMIEEERRELSAQELAHLGLQLGSAVRYLHANGHLHLDLKPSNIVAEGGSAKLIDLSLARPPGPAPAGIGTWCYLAPEQARGGDLGPATDVWGIGIVLFEAATRSAAFDDPDPLGDDEPSATADEETGASSATWESDDLSEGDYPQLREQAPPVGSLRELDPALAQLIDTCLRPEPADRPALTELLAGLEPVAGLALSERRWARAAALAS
jgi:eukaryotic-like serine/threonine-protein kinase